MIRFRRLFSRFAAAFAGVAMITGLMHPGLIDIGVSAAYNVNYSLGELGYYVKNVD